MKIPKSVQDLIEAFEQLPGIGPKTAARLTYYLLHAPDNLNQKFSEALGELKTKTKICSICQNITETDPCEVCEDVSRDRSIICVVEDPLDVWAIEKSGSFNGLYHVLHGVIAPLDNIGPEELKKRVLVVKLFNCFIVCLKFPVYSLWFMIELWTRRMLAQKLVELFPTRVEVL